MYLADVGLSIYPQSHCILPINPEDCVWQFQDGGDSRMCVKDSVIDSSLHLLTWRWQLQWSNLYLRFQEQVSWDEEKNASFGRFVCLLHRQKSKIPSLARQDLPAFCKALILSLRKTWKRIQSSLQAIRMCNATFIGLLVSVRAASRDANVKEFL